MIEVNVATRGVKPRLTPRGIAPRSSRIGSIATSRVMRMVFTNFTPVSDVVKVTTSFNIKTVALFNFLT